MVLWIVPRHPRHSSAGEPERFAPPSATQLRWGAGALCATFCNTASLGSRSALRHLLQHSFAGEPERFAPPSATQLRWGAGALRATFCNTAPLGSRSASRHLLQHSSAGEPERSPLS